MAFSAVAALASTATVAATTGSFLLGSAVSHFLVSTAIGAALNALQPKATSSVSSSGYSATTTGTTLSRQVIYGRTYSGSVRAYDETTGNNTKFLHRVLVFAGHEIEEFESFFIDGLEVTELEASGNVKTVDNTNNPDVDPDNYDGYITIKQHLGEDDQEADEDLVAASDGKWTTNHRLRGCAYIYVKLEFNQNRFPSGIPEIGAVIKGKKVHDPRTGDTAWSDNPVLCARDYITNATYGLGEDSEAVDDIVFSEEATASEGKYSCNGYFTADITPASLLESLLLGMGGTLWYSQGKWRIKSARWIEPELSFTADDLRSTLSVSTRHSRSDNFNTINGTFLGEESFWETSEFTPVTNQEFIDSDNGEVAEVDLDFGFTDTSEEARRVSNIFLERNRQQLTVSAKFGLRAFKCQVGDNIKFTYDRFGWTEKEFEVVSWTFGLGDDNDLTVDLTLRETAESIFDDLSDGDVYERDNTTLLSSFFVPEIGLSLSSEATELKNTLSNTLVVNTTASDETSVSYIDVEYKLSDSSSWINMGSGPLGLFKVLNLEVDDYDVRVRAVSTFGRVGDWVVSSGFTVNSLAELPENVTNLSFEVVGNTLNLSWDPVDALDLSHYRIRFSPLNNGGSWASSTTTVENISAPSTTVSLPLRSGEYFVKAYDTSGNGSLDATSVTVSEAFKPIYANTVEQEEFGDGLKVGTEIRDSALILSAPNPENDTGEYYFEDSIDLGTPKLVWAWMRCVNSRFDLGGGLWDELSGSFDSLEGLIDEFGSGSPSGDTTVDFFIRTTEDDPTGTPTWSDWRQFRAGNFYGRAFDFKVILKSSSENITPSVSELKAIVEYD